MGVPMSTGGSWEHFVRQTLDRMSSDLRAGVITVREDRRGRRYVVDAPSIIGRNIVVPCSADALLVPPQLPPRVKSQLFSPFTISMPGSDSRAPVPWAAIKRDYSVDFEPTPGHGFPLPEAIVVLRLRGSNGDCVFGWYVRLSRAPRRLVRVSPTACCDLTSYMADDPLLSESSLLDRYTDVGLDHLMAGRTFNSVAFASFTNLKTQIQRASTHTTPARKKRKHTDDSPPPTETVPTNLNTCVICLEEEPTSEVRCRHSSCRAHVCASCHSHTRGLCPVCDRAAINADYPCSHCNALFPLSSYGFPCVGCSANCLCVDCYRGFGQCGRCEVTPDLSGACCSGATLAAN